MNKRLLALAAASLILTPSAGLAGTFAYPNTHRDAVVDTYFGTPVADPYRWLEAAESPEVSRWSQAQNALTHQFVSTPERSKIHSRLSELWNYPKQSAPSHRGKWYFTWKNDGLQNQYVLLRHSAPDQPGSLVLDPNTLSSDGTISVSSTAISPDGELLAYGLSQSGSDTQTLHFRRLGNQQDLSDVVTGLSNANIDWHPDQSGVFYNRYPESGTVPGAQPHTHSRVYFHKLGTPQSQDLLVHADPQHPELDFYPFVSEDGAWLLAQVNLGTASENGLLYRPIGGGALKQLLPTGQASYAFIDNDGPIFYILTNEGAPRFRLVAIDVRQPERANWRELIPQQADVLESVTRVKGGFVASWLHDARHRLMRYDLQGKPLSEIALPAPGTASLRALRDDDELFFSFSSFVYPGEVYRYKLTDGKSQLLRRSQVKFDPEAFETRQVFVSSKDGTKVPVFLIHKKGLRPDGSHPLLLYGYGGFNISLLPHFALAQIPWLEAGGVYAVANLRGGAEYGEAWHKAGMGAQKQNVFDDFIAAGEWLIKAGWSHPRKLAIQGGSNGGLLTAACLTQRPDLYGAVISQVPVIDMLRYHRFSVGRYWIPEYGSAEASEDQFKTLLAYSPLHNLKPVAYPPTLVMSAEGDDRVVPAHALKFIAALQATSTGEAPHLLRLEPKAGHGAGKPTAKIIDEYADMYAFLFRSLGIEEK